MIIPLFLGLALFVSQPSDEQILPIVDLDRNVAAMEGRDGAAWYGSLKNGLRQGPGVYLWPDGSCLQGFFSDGEPDGECRHIDPAGRIKKMIYRHGVLIQSNWQSPEAFEKDGLHYGRIVVQGRYTGWYRGDTIRGLKPHGWGVMTYRNGSRYSGQWHDGRMHGNGTITWSDGGEYRGQWRAGKRTGWGSYRWPDGRRYIGHWNDNRISGEGMMHHADGRVEKGTWTESTVRITVPTDND